MADKVVLMRQADLVHGTHLQSVRVFYLRILYFCNALWRLSFSDLAQRPLDTTRV